MGWKDRISSYLAEETCLHAVGQGALAIECRKNDWPILEVRKYFGWHLNEYAAYYQNNLKQNMYKYFICPCPGGGQSDACSNSHLLCSRKSCYATGKL